MSACSLSPTGLAAQRARAAALRPAVLHVDRMPDALRIEFGPAVDSGLVAELVATERECCPFLELAYDERGHVLSIGSDDGDAVAAIATFFAQPEGSDA